MRPFAPLVAALLALTSCGGGHSLEATVPPHVATGGTVLPPALPAPPEVVSANGIAKLSLQAKFDADGPARILLPRAARRAGDSRAAGRYDRAALRKRAPGVLRGRRRLQREPALPRAQLGAGPARRRGGRDERRARYRGGLRRPDQPRPAAGAVLVPPASARAVLVRGRQRDGRRHRCRRDRERSTGGARTARTHRRAGRQPHDSSFAAGEAAIRRRARAWWRAAGARTTRDADQGLGSCAPDPETTPTIIGLPLATIGIKPASASCCA